MPVTTGATQIITAAEKLFATHGYDGVSVQQIADTAGASKANIYHHFSSKEGLYMAVLKHACQDMNELLAELNHADGPPERRLACFSGEHLKHLNLKSNISRLVLRELLDGSSVRARELAEQVFSEHFIRLRALLRKGQASGDIRDDIDADHMAAALVGMNVFLFQSWAALHHLPGNAFRDQGSSGSILFDLLFNGLTSHGDET